MTQHLDFSAVSGAVISDCGRYRYQLHRRWIGGEGYAVFLMLNPSTADSSIDDPTIRRCRRFAQDWGYEGLIVINLFAWRSTKPTELGRAADPVGKENDWFIREICSFLRNENAGRRPEIVCAWGAHPAARQRAIDVLDILAREKISPICLGTTQGGYPRHPLYVESRKRPQPYGVPA